MKTFIQDSMRTESSEFNMLVDNDANIYKPDKFTKDAAENRDLDAERKSLES